MTDLILLFASSFIAATIFPAGSEVVLATLNITGDHDKFLLLTIATAGNVLGALVNWFIGYYLIKFKDKKWFPVSQKGLDSAQKQFNKYGVYSLLFAWLPVVGDPLTVIGGIFKVRFSMFLLLVTLGKGARYLAVIALAVGFEKLF